MDSFRLLFVVVSSFAHEHIQATSEKDFEQKCVGLLQRAIESAIVERGKCVLGLSGGSTPQAVYEVLGEKNIDWSKVTIFLVDDRYVPADHEDSNQKLVQETLLKSAKVGEIIFPDTSLPLPECIADYDQKIAALESIDIVTLGLGEDGHIASLFPGDMDALLEEKKSVMHTMTDHFAVKDRITVTLPVLTRAYSQIFFLRGKGKKEIFGEMQAANTDPIEYPAHALLETGKTHWVTHW